MQRKDSFVIEFEDEAVGLVVQEHDRDGVVFHAVLPALADLNGRAFTDATDATRAVQRHLKMAA